jgi:hypothetical protein
MRCAPRRAAVRLREYFRKSVSASPFCRKFIAEAIGGALLSKE